MKFSASVWQYGSLAIYLPHSIILVPYTIPSSFPAITSCPSSTCCQFSMLSFMFGIPFLSFLAWKNPTNTLRPRSNVIFSWKPSMPQGIMNCSLFSATITIFSHHYLDPHNVVQLVVHASISSLESECLEKRDCLIHLCNSSFWHNTYTVEGVN